MLWKTTKKLQYFVRNRSFRRFRRFVVVFFVFNSFRRLSRLLGVRKDRFFVVFCRFLRPFFSKEIVVFLSFFRRLIVLDLIFLY